MRHRESKTQYAVLGMLSFEPQSGYEISQAIKNSTAFFWSESDGQLYPILKKLTQARLIQSQVNQKEKGIREKKIYAITQAGKKSLTQWLLQEPVTLNMRNEFLLQLFFGHNIKKNINIEKIKMLQQQLKSKLALFNNMEKEIREKEKNP